MPSKACTDMQILNPKTNRCINVFFVKKSGKASLNPKVVEIISWHVKGDLVIEKTDLEKLMLVEEAQQLFRTVTSRPPVASKPRQQQASSSKDMNTKKIVAAKKFVELLRQKASIKRLDDICNKRIPAPSHVDKFYTIHIPIPKLTDKMFNYIRQIQKPPPRPSPPLFDAAEESVTHSFYIRATDITEDFLLNRSVLASTYNSMDDYVNNIVDKQWVQAQTHWYMSLEVEDIFRLVGYTYVGDVLINTHKRGMLDEKHFFRTFSEFTSQERKLHPLFLDFVDMVADYGKHAITNENKVVQIFGKEKKMSDWNAYLAGSKALLPEKYIMMLHVGEYYQINFWKDVIERYTKNMQRLMKSAPATKHMMTVYRGVRNDIFLDGSGITRKHNGLEYYENKGFVSSSLNSAVSVAFLNLKVAPHCCLQRITILPGSRCILLMPISHYPEECEILLGDSTLYYVRNKHNKRVLIPRWGYEDMGLFCRAYKSPYNVLISDIVVVK